MVNKQGQTRLAQYYEVRADTARAQALSPTQTHAAPARAHAPHVARARRGAARAGGRDCAQVPGAQREAVLLRGAQKLQGTRLSLSPLFSPASPRADPHIPRHTRQVVYRRYASLYVLAGVDADENTLAALEVVHAYVEALDRYFGAVCELDIMFHLEKAHFILDEMIMNGAWNKMYEFRMSEAHAWLRRRVYCGDKPREGAAASAAAGRADEMRLCASADCPRHTHMAHPPLILLSVHKQGTQHIRGRALLICPHVAGTRMCNAPLAARTAKRRKGA